MAIPSKIHTLFLSYDGLTDPLGGSQILPYLCGLAQSQKYQIHIVSAEKPDKDLNQVHEICKTYGISWYPVTFRSQIKGFSAWQNLRALKKQAARVCNRNQIQILHARSLPMAVIAKRLASKSNAKVIFDMRGFWANERVEGGIWNIKNPVYKQLYAKMLKREAELLNTSNAVITLTQVAKQHVVNTSSACPAEKVTVIPCSVDMELFNAAALRPNRNKLRSELGVNDKMVFTYAGSIGTWYMLHEMMLFFSTVIKTLPQATFLIITKDQNFSAVQLEQQYKVPSGSIIVKSASRSEMPGLIACSDFGLFFIRPTFAKKGSSPTKLAEFLSLGIPIISNTGIGDMDDQFRNYKIGHLLNDLTPLEFNKAVDVIRTQDTFNENTIIEFARSFYDLQNAVLSYGQVYGKLTS